MKRTCLLAPLLLAASLSLAQEQRNERTITVPADRDVYVQVTDQEVARLNWFEIFRREFPTPLPVDFQQYSLERFFGLQHYQVWMPLRSSQPQGAGYLLPAEFVNRYGRELRGGAANWETLPKNRRQPQWIPYARKVSKTIPIAAATESASIATAVPDLQEIKPQQPIRRAPPKKVVPAILNETIEDSPPPPLPDEEPAPQASVYVKPTAAKDKTSWQDNDATGKLIGLRNWYIDVEDNSLYVAVSNEELRECHEKLYPNTVSWAWMQAFKDGFLRSVWYAQAKEPFYVMRSDKFSELKTQIDKVHSGKLPWQITRTRADDPN